MGSASSVTRVRKFCKTKICRTFYYQVDHFMTNVRILTCFSCLKNHQDIYNNWGSKITVMI